MKNPPHRGAFIRTEILDPLALTVTAPARALGVSRPTLSSLLNAQTDLSGDMALRIEKAFGVRTETLMRLQSSYGIVQTCQRDRHGSKLALRFRQGRAHETLSTLPQFGQARSKAVRCAKVR